MNLCWCLEVSGYSNEMRLPALDGNISQLISVSLSLCVSNKWNRSLPVKCYSYTLILIAS